MDENKRAGWRPLKGTLLTFLFLGLLGISFFFWKYNDVFPAASLDLKLSKNEIAARSRQFSEEQGYPTKDCIESTTFSERQETATFLEHEYTMREANELMHSKINVFFWYTRFCRPQEEEEFQVMLDPEGKLVAFSEEIEKEKALPDVSAERAMIMALKFVEEKSGQKLYKELPTKPDADQARQADPAQKAVEVSEKKSEGEKGAGDKQQNLERKSESDLAGSDQPADAQNAADASGATAGRGAEADTGPPGLLLADGIKLIRTGSVKQVNRTDHYFTWEDQSQDYKGGKQRVSVSLSGNKITSYEKELHIPEEFERKFADMRSYNDLLKSISGILFSIVGAAMFFAFVWALSTKKIRWRLVLIAGLVSFSVELLNYWNDWSAILQSYSTTESLQGYLSNKVVSSLIQCFMTGVSAAILIGGIEPVYRAIFPKKVAGEHILNWKMWSSRSLLETIMAGIFVFGIHIGYVAAFYLAGQHMGVWSPLEVRDVATLSSISPAFSSFTVGVNASVSEELLYRVLCFALAQLFFKKVLRRDSFWLANFVQAAGWAFMHSDYPQEPAYARGVELTIVGLFYGYLMRRYGVMAGVISHFIYDAFLGVTPLLLSPNIWLGISGILACSPPFIALGVGLFQRSKGKEVDDEALSNENLVPHQELEKEEFEERHLSYTPLSSRLKSALLLICILSSVVFLALEPRKMGTWAKMTVDKSQVIEIARKFMRERGVEEGDWRASAVLNMNIDEEEVQYGFEKEGYQKTEEIMKAARLPLLWWVRFYKPHQRREYDIAVSSEGRPVALQVTEEEEASGENLSREKARKLTEEFLKHYRPEFTPMEFDSVLEQKRKNRTDCSVSYVVPQFKMGEARLKISIDTVGGLVSFPHVTWDIPDKWRFERSKVTLKDHVAAGVKQVLIVILGIYVLVWAVGVFRSQAIHWRAAILAGLSIFLITMFTQVNELSYKFIEYDTDVPFLSFLLQIGIKALISSISYAAIFAGIFAAGHGAFRLLCPGVTLESLWHSIMRPPLERLNETKVLWMDGVLCAYAWLFALNALSVFSDYLEGIFSPDVQVQNLNPLVETTHFFSPAVNEILGSLMMGIASICIVPALVGFYMKYFRSFSKYVVCVCAFLLLVSSTMKYWQDYAVNVSIGIAEVIAMYFWIRYCAKNNPIPYFLVGALNAITGSLFYYYKFASNVYVIDLVIMLGYCLLPIIIAFALNARKSNNGKSELVSES